jgi:hypothetical protein
MELSQLKRTSKAKLVNSIANLVNSSKILKTIPQKYNDTICIGNYEIHPDELGYFIIDLRTEEIVFETYAKSAALAYAYTQTNRRTEFTKKIKELDSIIQKYDLDSRFYRNSLAGDTTVCKTSLITRLEMAVAEMDQARLELQSIILH